MAAQTPRVVEPAVRAIDGGRDVEVTLGQAEIKSNTIPMGPVVVPGGLLGALVASAVEAKIESDRSKRAEAAILPVRDALTDVDADDLALTTTKNAMAKVEWLQANGYKFSKDASQAAQLTELDAAAAKQVAYVTYTYDLSPDFSSVRVITSINFVNKAQPQGQTKPEARLNPKYMAYTQSIISVVNLPNPGAQLEDNAKLWAADKGKLIHLGLTQAFQQTETLIARSLMLSDDDVKAMTAKDKARLTLAGFNGKVQDTNNGQTLMWSDGFVQVAALNQTPVEATPAPVVAAAAPAPAAPADATAAPVVPVSTTTAPAPAPAATATTTTTVNP